VASRFTLARLDRDEPGFWESNLRVTLLTAIPLRESSIASAPCADGRVELSNERLPHGEVSPYLAIGDLLEVRRPIGGWFLSERFGSKRGQR
jgi:hypothetical protein